MAKLKTRTLALRLEDDLRAELEQQAERQGRPVSNLARAVLRDWVRRQADASAAPSAM
jgi:predicted transcriptional regulator